MFLGEAYDCGMTDEERTMLFADRTTEEKIILRSRGLREKELKVAELAIERAYEILNEGLDKDTRGHIVSIYKDVMQRHITQPENHAVQREAPPTHTTLNQLNITIPPDLSLEELKARTMEVMRGEMEAKEWKRNQLQQNSGSNAQEQIVINDHHIPQ